MQIDWGWFDPTTGCCVLWVHIHFFRYSIFKNLVQNIYLDGLVLTTALLAIVEVSWITVANNLYLCIPGLEIGCFLLKQLWILLNLLNFMEWLQGPGSILSDFCLRKWGRVDYEYCWIYGTNRFLLLLLNVLAFTNIFKKKFSDIECLSVLCASCVARFSEKLSTTTPITQHLGKSGPGWLR